MIVARRSNSSCGFLNTPEELFDLGAFISDHGRFEPVSSRIVKNGYNNFSDQLTQVQKRKCSSIRRDGCPYRLLRSNMIQHIRSEKTRKNLTRHTDLCSESVA